ncbi:CAP domain-containing protein [Desulfoscipio geothermicus]|uniref:Uncharacterized protein, YkwD family n=1 Tax=Desulfoscipio geothermicus DSM 3669 TaxID=1121426 RepID=A0A1I6DV81_9FIRM|nr:CAP domain-containing protein [Desulfoscipio geothermicus]SFR09252.1 uncharacterized protein, YkwD family [Desulfoscipio geothermicus DSM 3669]
MTSFRLGSKLLSFLAIFLLVTGLFFSAIPASPASAGTTLTISVSGNVSQEVLYSFIEQLIDKYNLNPDEIIIKYAGTTSKYNPDNTNASDPITPTPQPQPVEPKPEPAPSPAPTGLSTDEQKMLNLVNQERQQVGLAPLKSNLELVRLARLKAQDMIDLGYFGHTSPTYGSPFDMINSAGIKYYYAGENLAGAYSVDVAHNALMNSDGHRANILNPNFKEVGIGIVDGGPYGKMFVQLFIG